MTGDNLNSCIRIAIMSQMAYFHSIQILMKLNQVVRTLGVTVSQVMTLKKSIFNI